MNGWKQHGVGNRKSGEQAGASQHQPGFVGVPYRGHGIEHDLALAIAIKEWKQQANAEIETVQQDIKVHAQTDNSGPYRGKINVHIRAHSSMESAGRDMGRRPKQIPVTSVTSSPFVVPSSRVGPPPLTLNLY